MKHIFLVIAILMFMAMVGGAGADEVKFAWDPNEVAPEGYRLFQAVGAGPYDFAVPVWEGTDTTATIDVVAPKGEMTTYRYVVRAFVEDEESDNSNEITYTVDKRALATVQTLRIVIDININQ